MSTDIKRRILAIATEMLSVDGMKPDQLKIRDIAAQAGIGVGLINYHFQSKENLVHCCIRQMLTEIQAVCIELETHPDYAPEERLRLLCITTCDYLAEHANLSRISMLDDFQRSGFTDDNTNELMAIYYPAVQAVCAEEDETSLKWKTHLLLHGIQTAFLRSESIRVRIGQDFYQKEDRDQIAEQILRQLI